MADFASYRDYVALEVCNFYLGYDYIQLLKLASLVELAASTVEQLASRVELAASIDKIHEYMDYTFLRYI